MFSKGNYERALDIYDSKLHDRCTTKRGLVDMIDSTSVLYRLEMEGNIYIQALQVNMCNMYTHRKNTYFIASTIICCRLYPDLIYYFVQDTFKKLTVNDVVRI